MIDSSTYYEIDSSKILHRVGRLIGFRRSLLGISREELSIRTGISLENIIAYEDGHNSITVKDLVIISFSLQVAVDFFLSELNSDNDTNVKQNYNKLIDIIMSDELLEYLTIYKNLSSDLKIAISTILNHFKNTA